MPLQSFKWQKKSYIEENDVLSWLLNLGVKCGDPGANTLEGRQLETGMHGKEENETAAGASSGGVSSRGMKRTAGRETRQRLGRHLEGCYLDG